MIKRLSTCCLLFALAACQREARAPEARAPESQTAPAAVPAPAAPAAPVELRDVIERDPNYVIGISYPPNINQYPRLAAELPRYADAARSELMQAVDGLAGEQPSAPYDLSLAFNTLASARKSVV